MIDKSYKNKLFSSKRFFKLSDSLRELLFVIKSICKPSVAEELLSIGTLIRVLDQALANEVLKIFGPLRLERGDLLLENLNKDLLLVRAVSMRRFTIG